MVSKLDEKQIEELIANAVTVKHSLVAATEAIKFFQAEAQGLWNMVGEMQTGMAVACIKKAQELGLEGYDANIIGQVSAEQVTDILKEILRSFIEAGKNFEANKKS
jgi:hypothetical protein